MAHTNSIESVWALLKPWHYGTFHHFSVEHMQRYVDELTLRLNEGKCKIPALMHVNSLADKAVGVRIARAQLTGAMAWMKPFDQMVGQALEYVPPKERKPQQPKDAAATEKRPMKTKQ